MKKTLIEKFIDAFNQGYSITLPVITLTRPDVEETEEINAFDEADYLPRDEEIFTPLAPTLAVLYYQQLIEYWGDYRFGRTPDRYRSEIRKVLRERVNNPYFFDRFENYYWNDHYFSLVPESSHRPLKQPIKEIDEDLHCDHLVEIKYGLNYYAEERRLLQKKLNQLRDTLYAHPESIFKEKTVALIEQFQTDFDEYIAESVKSGLTLPIGMNQYHRMTQQASQTFLKNISTAWEVYEHEFFSDGNNTIPDYASFLQRLKVWLSEFIQTVKAIFSVKKESSVPFFQSRALLKQQGQDFLESCESQLSEGTTLKP